VSQASVLRSTHEGVDHDDVVTEHLLTEGVVLLAVHVRTEGADELRDVPDGAVQILVERQAAQLGQRRALRSSSIAASRTRPQASTSTRTGRSTVSSWGHGL
jgi:hypothetical protein